MFIGTSTPACARSISAILSPEGDCLLRPVINDKNDRRARKLFMTRVPACGAHQQREVDDRGYVYMVDRAGGGMHILELTGAARSREFR